MSENKQRHGNSHKPERDWDRVSNRNINQGYSSQSRNYNEDIEDYQNDNPRMTRSQDFNQGFNPAVNYGQYNTYRDWDDQFRNTNFETPEFIYGRNTMPQGRGYRDYRQGQYGGYEQRREPFSNYGMTAEPQYGPYRQQFNTNYNPGHPNESFYRGNSGWDSTQQRQQANYGPETNWNNRNESTMKINEQGTLYNSGPNKGKGPKGYHRSDDRIKEDINDRLMEDGMLDASDIEVEVENNEVILSGTVDSREAKRHAEYLAESIVGVNNVENRLHLNADKWHEQNSSSSTSKNESKTKRGSFATTN